MNEISVLVVKEEESLKLTWCLGGSAFEPYCIRYQAVIEAAQQIRDQLQILVQAFLKRREGEQIQYDPILYELAKKGYNLYELLFIDRRGREQEDIKNWVQNQHEQDKSIICFYVDNKINIPWGLIFDLDFQEGCFIEAKNFWCIKYSLSIMYSQLTPKSRLNQTTTAEFLSVINKSVYVRVTNHLSAQLNRHEEQVEMETKEIEWFSNTILENISSVKDLKKKLADAKDKNIVVSFYCHANGKKLVLDSTDEMTINDFERIVHEKDNTWMLFLNGCSTGEGSSEGGFIQILGDYRFCGFIGTETKIPDIFALRFGTTFWYELFSKQMTVLQTMQKMRRKHWPLSLVYTLYCYPMLSFKISSSFILEMPNNEANFCEGPIGTGERGVL